MMWKQISRQSLILLYAGLLFSSCNRTGADHSKSAVTQKPNHHNVEIKNMKFQPNVLFAHAGDTIIFTNDGIVPHDVTEINKAWTSSELPVGKSWHFVVTKSTDYYCSIHQVMKGKIIVK